jgi:drug/metabolite transporter (DMT)-like permease
MSNDLLALAAATCWAFGSLLSVTPSRYLGAIAFTRWRMLMVAIMLWLAVWVLGVVQPISLMQFSLIALSGFIGIFIGDTANFAAMNRLGPRRSGMLFSTNALLSALLGFVIFDERMNMQTTLGSLLTISGVMIAIMYGRRKTEDHGWESNLGHPGMGIALGLLAALCHSGSTLIAKPVMASNMDPVLASAIRVSVSVCGHYVLLWSGIGPVKPKLIPTPRILAQTALSGFVGMALGMTFLLLALRLGDLGMVAILSSVTPILILPLLWILLRRPPAKGAWFGAVLSVIGMALILSRQNVSS